MIERRCPLCGKKEKASSCPKCAVLTEEVERQDLRALIGLYILARTEKNGPFKPIKVTDHMSLCVHSMLYGPFELRKASILANQLRYEELTEEQLEEYKL